MINFNVSDGLVKKFLLRYLGWSNWKNLSQRHVPVAKINSTGDFTQTINVYHRLAVDQIAKDPNFIVGIDLKEGFKEALALNDTLPNNKHYVIFSGSYPIGTNPIALNHTLICHDHIMATMIDMHLSSTGMFYYNSKHYDFGTKKSLIFVSFAATPRLYRVQFAQWLEQLTYKNFVFRLNNKDWGRDANHLDFVDYTKSGTDVAQWFSSTGKHLPEPGLHIMGRIPTDMMNTARVNLVMESSFDHPTFDTTEKTVRSLLLGMPFILVSTPGHLARLQSMGFRTYHDIWDESYDKETDDKLRLQKIFGLVQSLNDIDWNKHSPSLQNIALHNRANFLTLGHWFEREFLDFESKLTALISPSA